jgi:hypothetical protein
MRAIGSSTSVSLVAVGSALRLPSGIELHLAATTHQCTIVAVGDPTLESDSLNSQQPVFGKSLRLCWTRDLPLQGMCKNILLHWRG